MTKHRARAILGGTAPDTLTSEHAVIVPTPVHPDQALQVLTLAQRTAEEHIAGAGRHADKIRDEAQKAADQIARDAQVYSHNVRSEADKVLLDARATAEQAARDARARSEDARKTADQIVAEARGLADSIIGDARRHSEQLELQAQHRFEDAVGSLGARREALQQQIEALELFDREYRSRLTSFMQGQLRALWAEEPRVIQELLGEEPGTPGGPTDMAIPSARGRAR